MLMMLSVIRDRIDYFYLSNLYGFCCLLLPLVLAKSSITSFITSDESRHLHFVPDL